MFKNYHLFYRIGLSLFLFGIILRFLFPTTSSWLIGSIHLIAIILLAIYFVNYFKQNK